MRDLDYGASLIMTGELDQQSREILFGEGDWMSKRDAIMSLKELKQEETGEKSKNRSRNRKRRGKRTSIGAKGDIYFDAGENAERIGWVDITNPDSRIQALAQRAADAIKRELG